MRAFFTSLQSGQVGQDPSCMCLQEGCVLEFEQDLGVSPCPALQLWHVGQDL